MKIEDEYGERWLVEAHDPARAVVLGLARAGFDWQVLPGKLLRGTMTLAEAASHLTLLPTEPSGPPHDSLPRLYRLRDCLGALVD